MRKLRTVVVEINQQKPADMWDVEVERGREDVEWWAFGANSMTIVFKSASAAPTQHPNSSKLSPWTPPVGAIAGAPHPAVPGCIVCRLDHGTHGKSGNYAAYTVTVQYQNGVVFTLDPFVIIQP